MAKKLYVGNLSYDVDEATLTAWFSAMERLNLPTSSRIVKLTGAGDMALSK